jgi:hypothetical protein
MFRRSGRAQARRRGNAIASKQRRGSLNLGALHRLGGSGALTSGPGAAQAPPVWTCRGPGEGVCSAHRRGQTRRQVASIAARPRRVLGFFLTGRLPWKRMKRASSRRTIP